jgi:hypothetical protein
LTRSMRMRGLRPPVVSASVVRRVCVDIRVRSFRASATAGGR